MHIKFRIVSVKWPKALADWRDYVIAEVRVVHCSAKPEWNGTTQIFKGNLPSRAPYFIFETTRGAYIGFDKKSFTDIIMCSKETKWQYHRNLTVEGIVYILTQEFPLAAAREDAELQEFTATRALDEIRRMVQQGDLTYDFEGRIDEKMFQSLPVFKQAVARSCDYFRLEFMDPLRLVYDRTASKHNRNDPDQMKQLQVMTPQKLVGLYNMTVTAPWLLCLPRFCRKQYDMKPISQDKALRLAGQHGIVVPQRYRVGISLLDHIKRKLYTDSGHTVFYVSWLKQHYLQTDIQHAQDKELLDSGLSWLVSNGGLVWLQKPDLNNANIPDHERHGVLALPKTKNHVTIITETFAQVAERAHTYDTYPEVREQGVVKIPPILTDEQTEAMLHILHNWLTLVVGPPGRGKTAVIEAAFAHYYGICNITYVGTMVASQRERLGGRVESSHTAHSMYQTMGARDETAREWYLGQIEALIWDEFSNVDESLLSHVLKCFRDSKSTPLCRMLFIFDIHQINPISPSCCAKDLIQAFPMHIRKLTVNLRVDPIYRALADIALLILHQKINEIDFGTDLNTDTGAVILQEPASVAFTEPFAYSPGYNMVRDVMRYFRVHGGIKDPMKFKFITPTRKMRKHINDAVELILFKDGWITNDAKDRRITMRNGFDIYPGAIIAISGATFKPPKKPLHRNLHVSEMRNGEILRVTMIRAYENSKGIVNGAYYITCETRSGKRKNMVIDKNLHVDPHNIIRGNCVTIDASQGSEWPMTCAFYHDGAGDHTWITMERLYVSASRAQRGMVLVAPGGRETLRKIASRRMPRRYSALAHSLSHNTELDILKSVVPLEACTKHTIRDPEDMELMDNARISAVPQFPGLNITKGGRKRRKR